MAIGIKLKDKWIKICNHNANDFMHDNNKDNTDHIIPDYDNELSIIKGLKETLYRYCPPTRNIEFKHIPGNISNVGNNIYHYTGKDNNIYCYEEIDTGKKWLDGKPIYRKILNPFKFGYCFWFNNKEINLRDDNILEKYNLIYKEPILACKDETGKVYKLPKNNKVILLNFCEIYSSEYNKQLRSTVRILPYQSSYFASIMPDISVAANKIQSMDDFEIGVDIGASLDIDTSKNDWRAIRKLLHCPSELYPYLIKKGQFNNHIVSLNFTKTLQTQIIDATERRKILDNMEYDKLPEKLNTVIKQNNNTIYKVIYIILEYIKD